MISLAFVKSRGDETHLVMTNSPETFFQCLSSYTDGLQSFNSLVLPATFTYSIFEIVRNSHGAVMRLQPITLPDYFCFLRDSVVMC